MKNLTDSQEEKRSSAPSSAKEKLHATSNCQNLAQIIAAPSCSHDEDQVANHARLFGREQSTPSFDGVSTSFSQAGGSFARRSWTASEYEEQKDVFSPFHSTQMKKEENLELEEDLLFPLGLCVNPDPDDSEIHRDYESFSKDHYSNSVIKSRNAGRRRYMSCTPSAPRVEEDELEDDELVDSSNNDSSHLLKVSTCESDVMTSTIASSKVQPSVFPLTSVAKYTDSKTCNKRKEDGLPSTSFTRSLMPPFSSFGSMQPLTASEHTRRYAVFVQRYFDLTPEEAQKEAKYIRTTRVSSMKCSTSAGGLNMTRSLLSSTPTAAMSVPRHSAVAVEGDYLFHGLIQRAVRAEKQLQHSLEAEVTMGQESSSPTSSDTQAWCKKGEHIKNRFGRGKMPLGRGRSLTEPLRPNARCIALYYGFEPETKLATKEAAKKHRRKSDSLNPDSVLATEERRKRPRASLLAILTTTPIEKGEEVIVSLSSYFRCLDEITWYETQMMKDIDDRTCEDDDVYKGREKFETIRDFKAFSLWPKNLRFYHGHGAQHASQVAQASYPFTLVNMKLSPEIGPKEVGLYAHYPIPYATCFIYGGAVANAQQVAEWEGNELRSETVIPDGTFLSPSINDESTGSKKKEVHEDLSDDTYVLGLDDENHMCFGQGLARYINHRYNLSSFGNVELCSITLPMRIYQYACSTTAQDLRPRMISIPFFITTTDIPAESPLLAWTYGEAYDAKLERVAVAGLNIVPFIDAAVLNRRCSGRFSLLGNDASFGQSVNEHSDNCTEQRVQRYEGDYRFALQVGDIVWRRKPVSVSDAAYCTGGDSTNEGEPDDLYVIVELQHNSAQYALLQPLYRHRHTRLSKEECSTYRGAVERSSLCWKEEEEKRATRPHRKRHRGEWDLSPSEETELFYRDFALFAVPQGNKKSDGRLFACSRNQTDFLAVSSTAALGLLLSDIDYCEVEAPSSASRKSNSSSFTESNEKQGRVLPGPQRWIVVPLTSWRTRTALTLRESRVTVPPWIHPSLWPLIRSLGKDGKQIMSTSQGFRKAIHRLRKC